MYTSKFEPLASTVLQQQELKLTYNIYLYKPIYTSHCKHWMYLACRRKPFAYWAKIR